MELDLDRRSLVLLQGCEVFSLSDGFGEGLSAGRATLRSLAELRELSGPPNNIYTPVRIDKRRHHTADELYRTLWRTGHFTSNSTTPQSILDFIVSHKVVSLVCQVFSFLNTSSLLGSLLFAATSMHNPRRSSRTMFFVRSHPDSKTTFKNAPFDSVCHLLERSWAFPHTMLFCVSS